MGVNGKISPCQAAVCDQGGRQKGQAEKRDSHKYCLSFCFIFFHRESRHRRTIPLFFLCSVFRTRKHRSDRERYLLKRIESVEERAGVAAKRKARRMGRNLRENGLCPELLKKFRTENM